MTPERFRLLEELYDAASTLPPAERNRFIEERCAHDDDLRRELAAAFRDESSGLTGIVEQAAAGETEEAWAGRRMGPYRIVRPLGRGGMGAVYLAVRDDDQFHKEVALKTLKFELEGGPAVARFRHERQILAHLEHPNIARLIDGGASDQGTPYLVLEYVAGVPIDAWCEKQQLSIEQRLHLFRHVCDAVQYAHQHLIVHRDLKPGNILVTAEGVPKLLDFGIAKLLDANRITGARPLTATATGLLLMTPDYASPEQVRGEAVSTATDVYSLGAVLYQLLTGQRPYAFQNYDPVEIARVVCDTEIHPPSALGNRRLRGDLDLIVLKAMQKDPARRYPSVVEFSEDIRRHLDGLPIAARPDTTVYRAVKFVRRNRLSVSAAAAIVLALATGLAIAQHQARIAERRFAQVRELANTFLFQFYDQVTPLPGSTAVRASMVETARKYLDGLAQDAGNDKSLILELAQAYGRLGDVQGLANANLGQLDDALRNYQRALDLFARVPVLRTSPPELRRRVAAVLYGAGRLEINRARENAAEPYLRRTLDLLGDDRDPVIRIARARALRELGLVRVAQGKTAEAVQTITSAVNELLAVKNSGFQESGLAGDIEITRERLAGSYIRAGDLDEAMSIYQQLLRDAPSCEESPPGPVCEFKSTWLENLADLYGAVGRPSLGEFQRAAALYQQSIQLQERTVAADPKNRRARFYLAARYGKLGDCLWRTDPHRALALYDRAFSTAQALVSKDQLEAIRGAYVQAVSRPLLRLHRTAEARRALEEMDKINAADPPANFADRIGLIANRMLWPPVLDAEGKHAEARSLLRTIIAELEKLRAQQPTDLTPVLYQSDCYRQLAAFTTGPERRDALLHSAAAWHSWPATTYTRREEQKDLAAARLN